MPNQYTIGHICQRDRILAYVEDKPMCLSREISAALGISRTRISQEMAVLHSLGRVRGHKSDNDKARRWEISDSSAFARGEKPERRFVKEWTGHARDAWHCLFFGEAAA